LIKLTYHGTEKEINDAVKIIRKNESVLLMRETKARLKIQKLIDQHQIRATIMVNGNPVWSKDRIISNLEKLMKVGSLYNQDQRRMPNLSYYFYQFLWQVCGSSQHCDIHGWIHKYSTIEHLRKFFKRNEFGVRVFDHIPKRMSDARSIVKEIELNLFPFTHYMKTHPTPKKLQIRKK
jgi:hypothetical protein